MKQRRMLMSGYDYEKELSNANYITSGGTDSSTAGSATISKALLEDNKVYYIFGYYYMNFAVFRYFNGTVTTLFHHRYDSILTLEIGTSDIKLLYGTSYNARSIGLTVLTFGVNMDNFFKNMNSDLIDGESYSSSSTWPVKLSNFYDDGVRYLFEGAYSHFCIYKIEGVTFADLTPLFNYNLYQVNYGDTFVKHGYTPSSTNYTYGFTRLSVKR